MNETRKAYYDNKFSLAMDRPRKFFRLLNNITGKSKISSDYPNENDRGARIADQKQAAQLFNKKFVSIELIPSSNANMMPWNIP